MSDEVKNLPFIPDDAIMTIEVSGYFHKQLINLLVGLGETRSADEFNKVLARLKDDNPPEGLFELNVDLVLSLINDIEKAAKEQNKIVYKDITFKKDSTGS